MSIITKVKNMSTPKSELEILQDALNLPTMEERVITVHELILSGTLDGSWLNKPILAEWIHDNKDEILKYLN